MGRRLSVGIMLKGIKNLSLQLKIMAIFLAMSILLTLTLGLMFYNNTAQNVKQNKENEITTLADETANKIERFLFEREADIQVMAQSQILTMDQIDRETKRQYLENVINNYKTYDEIFVLNQLGETVLSATFHRSSLHMESNELFVEKPEVLSRILSGQPFISDVLSEAGSDQWFILFSEPLVDEKGERAGAVVERMNFDAIDEIIANVKLGEAGYAKLMPSDNHYGVSYEILDAKNHLSVRVPIIKYETQSKQWMLFLSEPTEEAFALIHDIRIYFGLVFIITLIILFLVSNYLSKRITQPIRTLKLHMGELLETHKLNMALAYEGTSDEVKQLTHTFDFLLEELSFMVQKTMEKTGEAESVKSVKSSLDAMIEHAVTGIVTIDGKGVITSVNPRVREILKEDSDENFLVGLSIVKVGHPRFDNFFMILRESITDEKQLVDIRCMIKQPDVQLIVSTLIQKDIYHTPIGVTVMLQSAEAQERFEHSVIRAKKLSELGELSAGVAHEIRNPLASIKGYTQMAVRELDNQSDAHHDLGIVLKEVDRLDRLVERFLSFASPNTPNYSHGDMNQLILESIKVLKQQIHAKKIEVIQDLDVNSNFEYDADQMKQVLLNLLINAIQASEEGGVINIHTAQFESEGKFSLSIKNDGDLIDEELKDRIFTPFFTTRASGSGLGLAICARIVENHHGTLELMSTKETGTTFVLNLPTKKGLLL